jgi:hypothetical protein
MAKMSTARKARRAAERTTNTNDSAAVIFNPRNAATKAAIEYGIDHGTSSRAKALVEQFRLAIVACQKGGMKPTHADVLVEEIRKGIAAKRKAASIKSEFEVATWAQRKSEAAAVLKLHEFACVKPLFATLADIDVLTFEGLAAIARWMRGAHGKNGAWQSTTASAPSKAKLLGLLAEKRTRTSKSKRKGGFAKGKGVVGMPSDAVRGLAHVLKCAKAFNATHAKHFAKASDAKMFAAVIDNINACFKPTRALVATREKAAAEAVSK